MDVVNAASNLRDQMIILDVVQIQKETLDEHITSLSQQSFLSSLEGNTVRCHQLSLRLSVYEGVQNVYKQIRDKKWHEVQTTARSILAELQDTDVRSPVTSSVELTTSTDRTAASWSRAFCDFYRDN